MEDDTIVKTENALKSWSEGTDWDGNNYISRATGSQWEHEELYKSRKGRYYIESTSQWQGSPPHAEFVSKKAAAAWLINNEYEVLPGDLKEFEGDITE
jgi:hypothetical protein